MCTYSLCLSFVEAKIGNSDRASGELMDKDSNNLDLYPGQANARPMLWLCDRVLHDQSDELDWTIRGYLRHCGRDYNEKNAKLQLRATLIFVTDTDPPPRC